MGTGSRPTRGRSRGRRGLVLLLACSALVAAACSGSADGEAEDATQTLVFATHGLGAERTATEAAVKRFERENPTVSIKLEVLPQPADATYKALTRQLAAGSGTPDVMTLDVIWPAALVQAGWLAELAKFAPQTQNFFRGQVQAGTVDGRLYAIPWFINAEGLYYRTDLVPKPPQTPAELLQAAQTALTKDPALKSGLAFAGARYEGAVTTLINFLGGFGGQLDPENLNTPANRKALEFMRDVVHRYQIAPRAVTGWQERQVELEFLEGRTAFAMNWPYVFQLAEQDGSVVKGKTGWIPFPSVGPSPAAALGGQMLGINAKSRHQAMAWKFIQFLTSDPVQIERAITAGDPPAVWSAYTDQLYAKAPYFRQQKAVFQHAVPRPAAPKYPQISVRLQEMLAAVLSNKQTPAQALAAAAADIAPLG